MAKNTYTSILDKNFLAKDLQELEKAYTGIRKIISDRVDLLIKEDVEIDEHLETIRKFLSYWQNQILQEKNKYER